MAAPIPNWTTVLEGQYGPPFGYCARVPTLTTTGACVLGLLEMGPPPPARREPGPEAMTGWQIYETANVSLARFWNITRSQVYLELGRLEQDGLVASTGAEGPHA